MRLHYNAGTVKVSKVVDMTGYGVVWFCPDEIADILSLAMVSDKLRVTLDTAIDQAFHVIQTDRRT